MIFLRDEDTAEHWVAEEAGLRDAFPLTDAVRFAGAYFCPLVGR